MTMAIIRPLDRPALRVAPDQSVDWSLWPDAVIPEPPHERVTRTVAAVGRLLVRGGPFPWAGSCFLAGPGLVLAASFAVNMVTEGAGKAVTLQAGKQLPVQFADGRVVEVERVLFLHPYFRVALLQLADSEGLPDPLSVASTSPENLGGHDVALISCAAKDPRNDLDAQVRIFGEDPDQSFFVQPGKVLGIGAFSEGEAPGLLHDCSCLGGSSGGPLVELESGDVLGLHTSGRAGTHNYAEPLWELARDPEVWDYDIAFRPAAKPTWLDAWGEPVVPQSPQPSPGQAPGTWTVNQLPPLDFAHPTVQLLLQTLFTNIDDVEVAMTFALDSGVTRGTVDDRGTPEMVWRRILVKASTKGVLGNLVRRVHDHPDHGAIAPILAQML